MAQIGAAHGEVAVALQPMEVYGGAEIHLQALKEPHQSRWMSKTKKVVIPWEAYTGAGSLMAKPLALWREELILE